MRSLSTSLVALLPVISMLVVGSFILGATTLEDFALALLAGLFVGAYSSIFVATPLLVWVKEREPQYKAIKQRRAASGRRGPARAPAMARVGAGAPNGRRCSTADARRWPPTPTEPRRARSAGRSADADRAPPPPAAGPEAQVAKRRPRYHHRWTSGG